MTQTHEAPDKLLDRVRKLLAKAEDESCTPPEAEALTAKAAELMAKYGIDRALLAAVKPETDQPGSKFIEIDNPWGRVKAHLLCGLGSVLRCQAIMITTRSGLRVHMFGYESDLERLDVLYTSILMQMWHGMAVTRVPDRASPRSWRRSWLLGFTSAVIARVRLAEAQAITNQNTADGGVAPGRKSGAEMVLADRSLVIRNALKAEYPVVRNVRLTYSGSGYGDGHQAGQRADIGQGRVSNSTRALA